LQKQLYGSVDPSINFQIHCKVGRLRHWITLDEDVIFDFPGDFQFSEDNSPEISDGSEKWDMINEYISTPDPLAPQMSIANDNWGLADILKSADKRIPTRIMASLLSNMDCDKRVNIDIAKIMPRKILTELETSGALSKRLLESCFRKILVKN